MNINEQTITQLVKDNRKNKKLIHKLHVRNKQQKKQYSLIIKILQEKLEQLEREVSYCKKYDSYYDEY